MLLVDGDADPARPSRGEAFYLRIALDPRDDGSSGIRPEVVTPGQLGGVDFNNYDLVVLLDVPDLPAERDSNGQLAHPQAEALRKYVAAGGALAIFAGDRMDLDFYNGPLFLSGLSPMEVSPAVGDASAREQFVTFRPGSAVKMDMLRAFAGESDVFSGLVRFYRYLPAKERAVEQLPPEAGAGGC